MPKPPATGLAALPRHTTIALPTATSIIERIGADLPGLRILPVASEADALGMVEAREADLTLRALTIAAHKIKSEGWFNLKIAGELAGYGNRLRIGLIGRQPEMLSRLDDAIDTLKEEEVNAIVNRHVSIEAPMRINYRLTVQVAAGLLALLVVAYLSMRHLRALNRRLAELSARLHRTSRRASASSRRSRRARSTTACSSRWRRKASSSCRTDAWPTAIRRFPNSSAIRPPSSPAWTPSPP